MSFGSDAEVKKANAKQRLVELASMRLNKGKIAGKRKREEEESSEPRRSPRYSMPPLDNFYGNSPVAASVAFPDSRRGCKRGSVVLRPHSLALTGGLGSDADPDLPSCIKQVRSARRDIAWVSGHVINADFGGDGGNAANQTCLTSRANRDHKVDDGVKKAWAALTKAFGEMYRAARRSEDAAASLTEIAENWGIRLEATVRETAWGSKYPENCITTGIVYTVQVVGKPNMTSLTRRLGLSREQAANVKSLIAGVSQAVEACAKHTVDNTDPDSDSDSDS